MKEWKLEHASGCLDADIMVTGGIHDDNRRLKITLKGSLDSDPQTIVVTGGNIEVPAFFELMEHIKPRVLGTESDIAMNEVPFAPR